MKKQLSSIDMHFLISELEIIKDSRIDKIYHPEKNILIFSLHKSNVGKKRLRIDIGKFLSLSEEKDEGDTLGFGMLLRKHLDGYFLTGIEQVEPERIVKLAFKIRDSLKYLFIEFFGKGNAVLCDEHSVIINALEHHEFRERVVKPRLKYVYPVMSYNLFDLKKEDLVKMAQQSKKDSIIVSLATELGLGGIYSEEVCLLGKIDKNKKPQDLSNDEISEIFDSIKSILSKKIEAKVVYENGNVIDFLPFEFEFYKNSDKKDFGSFNEAVSFFFSQFKEVKETAVERRIKELEKITEEQKLKIGEMRKEEIELKEKGEMIYHKYILIKEVLEELNKASEKYSWKEIKEKLKGHKVIKEVNEKEKKVVVEV